MSSEHHLPHPGDSAFRKLAAVLVLIVVAGIIGARFLPETGLVKPNSATRAVVASTVDVERALAENADFQVFAEALKVAVVARRTCPVRNTADGRVLHIIDGALDAYSAYRLAWQTELESAWDAETLGDSAYWEATYPDLGLPTAGGSITPEQVKTAAEQRAHEQIADAIEVVER